jgi:drug/metabolite transporter (DMT)-like permease
MPAIQIGASCRRHALATIGSDSGPTLRDHVDSHYSRWTLGSHTAVQTTGRKIASRAKESSARKRYRLGITYSILTATFLATQEPFSALAARRLSAVEFVCLTQVALLLSIPLLTLSRASGRDFRALLLDVSNLWKFSVLFIVGLAGLLLYNIGLSNSHPIVIAAILNLSPFWAALVSLFVVRKAIPVSPPIFFGCLAVAFVGAMMIAWSQMDGADGSLKDIAKALTHGSWIFAIPIPIFSALSGTLVGRWFSQYEEAAAVAANFLVSSVILIPSTLLLLHSQTRVAGVEHSMPAVLLLLVGTLVAAAAGRVLYQIALTATDNDNGFVTMFFLLVPGLTCLVSLPLSWWIADLRFAPTPLFFSGMLIVALPLMYFCIKSWRSPHSLSMATSVSPPKRLSTATRQKRRAEYI